MNKNLLGISQDSRSDTGNPVLAGLASLLLVLLFGTTTLQAQPPFSPQVTIGIVSGQVDTAEAFNPFTSYLEQQLPGYRFQVTGFQNIETLMRAVENESLDFAFTPPAAYVELSLDNNLRILSTLMQQIGDTFSPWLASAIITRESRTDINTLADVSGKRVAALSEIALGGWLSAAREWRDLGLNVETDFASLDFKFSYTSVVEAVCSGSADVGVINAEILPSLTPQCGESLKVLPLPNDSQGINYMLPRSTRLYPEAAFVMIGVHDEEFIRLLTRVLLQIEHNSPVALSVFASGFTVPLQYNDVQSMMQELRLGPWGELGALTLRQLLLDNIILITLTMLVVMALIFAGFINTRRLNRRFRDSESYRKLVFEGSHIPMVIVDPDTLTYLDMNPAAVRQYGFDNKEELTNLSVKAVTASEQDIDTTIEEAFEKTRRQVMEEGHSTFNWRHVRPDGEEWIGKIHLMAFASPNGKLIQATVEDITQQKLQEEEHRNLAQQLEFSQRMESIGRLAGGIAHDFNNLLTIINGYCEVLMQELSSTQSAKILQQIRKAGIRATELTQQLLTFSRRQAIRQIPVDVNRVIHDAAEMIRSVLGDESRLQLYLMKDSCHVLSDPGQLQQVLLNLVVNAKDAMPDGGVLKISTAKTFLTPRNAKGLEIETGDYIEIRVTDNGIGMSQGIMQHIFEPFFTTKENSGTGLGLSTVYGIVQQSMGTIQVSSKEGEGTTFQVLLPETDEAEQTAEDEERTPLPSIADPCCILVVEDQEEVLDYATSVLRQAGYRVHTACSGNEALAFMNSLEEPVHLLLTDVVMEGMSGGELAEVFCRQYPDIPVLFSSGYPGDELARYGVREGSREFLAKPFSPKELLARVEQILNNTPVLS